MSTPHEPATDAARPAQVVTDDMVTAALHAAVPGGSQVWWWLPSKDGHSPHDTARVVMRRALEAAVATLPEPQAAPADPDAEWNCAISAAMRAQPELSGTFRLQADGYASGWQAAVTAVRRAIHALRRPAPARLHGTARPLAPAPTAASPGGGRLAPRHPVPGPAR